MPEDPAISARPVFVYGTLRRGDDNDITRLRPAPRWVGPARIKGVMYHFGRYPGVALGGADDVVGEVYEISPALEAVLDEIEEVYPQQTNEYAKRVIGVDVQGRRVECIVYEINPDRLGGRARIASGDWVKDR